jgi:chaperone BCS1
MTDINSLLTTGVLLSAAAAAVAFQLRSLPLLIFKRVQRRFVYTVKIYQPDEMFDQVEKWMSENYQQVYKDVEACMEWDDQSECRFKKLVLKQEDNTSVIRYKGRRLLISKGKEKLDKATNLRELFSRHYTIRGYMAKATINEFLEEVVRRYNESKRNSSLRVYANTSYGEFVFNSELQVKSFDQVILPKELKEEILADARAFVDSKAWYQRRGIPYKRGFGFYGLPGNGKTTIAMALGQALSRDVYVLNLNSYEKDDGLLRSFRELPKNCILLIEDIDRAFNGRDAVDTSISFSTLLNCLDGALFREGMIVIITTNHLDKLDPALIRSGRIDLLREVHNPSPDLIREYLNLFYDADVTEFIPDTGMSMSKVQETCLRYKNDLAGCIAKLQSATLKQCV